MWSSQYTGQWGNIPSNAHRLSLYIDIDEYINNNSIINNIIDITLYDINNDTIASDCGSHYIFNINIRHSTSQVS
jgi:hypothetical protein